MGTTQTKSISDDELVSMLGTSVINYTWSDDDTQPCYKSCLPIDEINKLDIRKKLMKGRKTYYLYDDHKSNDIEAMKDAGIPFELAPDGAVLINDTYRPFLAKLSAKRELRHCSAINIYIDNRLYSEGGVTSITDPDVIERVYAQVMDKAPKLDFYTTSIN